MSDHPVEFDRVTRYFGAEKALDSLCFAVPAGSVIALLGRNGAGSSSRRPRERTGSSWAGT